MSIQAFNVVLFCIFKVKFLRDSGIGIFFFFIDASGEYSIDNNFLFSCLIVFLEVVDQLFNILISLHDLSHLFFLVFL